MAQQIINTGTEPNDGTGEPLRSAFNAVNQNFTEIYTAGPVGSNVVISANVIAATGVNGNLILSGNGIGTVQLNSSMAPTVNAVFNIGSPTAQFNTVYADYFVGNGALLTGIAGGSGSGNSISNGDSNVVIATQDGDVVVSVDGAANVAVFQRQTTILTSNLLPGTDVTYDIGSANRAWKDLYLSNSTIYLGNSTIQSNATSFTLTTSTGNTLILQGDGALTPYGNANVAAYLPTNTSNIRGGNISATGNVSGQFIIGDGGFLSNVVATGNVAVTQLGNGTSVLRVDGSGGNIISTVGGVPNVQVVTPTGVEVTGTVQVTGNVSGDYFFGNASTMSGLPEAYSNAKVESVLESYTGNLSANVVSAASVEATQTISAQGNVLAQGAISAVGNIVTDSFFIGNFQGNITGNFTVPGSNTQVIFNGDGNAAAAAGFTYDNDSNTVSVLGTISAQANIIGGNIVTAGEMSAATFVGNGAALTDITAGNIVGTVAQAVQVTDAAQSNITSVGTLTGLDVSGTISANSLLINRISSDDSTAVIIDDSIEVNGDIVADNLTASATVAAADITASGNVIGNYFSGNGAGLTAIAGANITGTVTQAAQVTDAAQPNITSVGTLTGLDVNGDIAASTLTINRINSDDSTTVTVDDNLEVNGVIVADSLTTSGNVTADYFIGDGSQLTGGYGNSNVEAYLPTYTGNLVSLEGNVTTTGNVSADYFIGNGSQLTGVVATDIGTLTSLSVTGNIIGGNVESQALVSAVDVSISGNITGGTGSNLNGIAIGLTTAEAGRFTNLSVTGNVTIDGETATSNITANGTISASGQITSASINSIGNLFAGNINTALISATDIDAVSLDTSGNISATGNITGSYFFGNGSQLTGVVSSYGDSNVEAYLPTYTGNLVSLEGNVTTTANISANNVSIGNVLTTDSIITTGDTTIGGNLTVNGNTIQVNIEQLNIEDPIIGVGRGANNQPLTTDDGKARGVQLWYYDAQEEQAFIGWDTANSVLVAAANVSITDELVTVNNYGAFAAGNITASSVTATGNIVTGAGSGGNISGANVISANTVSATTVSSTTISATGNAVVGNAAVSGTVSVTGNITAAAFNGSAAGLTFIPAGNIVGSVALADVATVAGTVTTAAQPNITSVGLLTSVTITGNVSSGNLVTTGVVDAVGNVSGGNIVTAGVVDAVGTITGGDIATTGTVSAVGNVSGGNLVAQADVTASGNVGGNNIFATNLIQSDSASITGNIVSGNITTVSANITDTLTAATVAVSTVSATGNISVVGNVTADNFIGNFEGNLTAPGANTQILFNEDGAISAGTGLVFDYVGNTLTVGGDISSTNGGNLTVSGAVSVTGNVSVGTGNINGGNILASFVGVTGNISGGNVVTTGQVSAAGNITAGNLITDVVTSANPISIVSTGNVEITGHDSSSILLAENDIILYASANVVVEGNLGGTGSVNFPAGNITGGNIVTAGQVSATGNIAGGNVIAVGNLSGTQFQSTNITLLAPTIGNTAGERVRLYDFANVEKTNYAIGVETSAIWMGVDTNLEGQGFKWYGSNVEVARLSGVGNLDIAGNFVANANITGDNLVTAGIVSATGNIVGGNLVTAGSAEIAGNITAGNVNTGGLSLSGNVVSAINTVNNITTTGNITANNMAATTSININGNPVATVDDATALAIALG